MIIRRVVTAALSALLLLLALETALAQSKVRLILKDLDTDQNADAFISLVEKGMAAAGMYGLLGCAAPVLRTAGGGVPLEDLK